MLGSFSRCSPYVINHSMKYRGDNSWGAGERFVLRGHGIHDRKAQIALCAICTGNVRSQADGTGMCKTRFVWNASKSLKDASVFFELAYMYPQTSTSSYTHSIKWLGLWLQVVVPYASLMHKQASTAQRPERATTMTLNCVVPLHRTESGCWRLMIWQSAD